MADAFDLGGKLVLVTGGTRGIGRAVTLEFARAGATVVANFVRGQKTADALEEEARHLGVAVTCCRADLTSDKGLDATEEAVSNAGGALSCLVHCAATGVHKPFSELTARHFDWTFALNVRAFFVLVGRLLPRMNEGTSIVAVSSQGATHAVQDYAAVGASKGALESLARHLAVELAPRGIRVNILVPGSVVTDAWDAMPDQEARLAEVTLRTPTGSLTTPQQVAQVAHFLCSDAAGAIVGHTLVVDGGASIRA